MRLILWLLVICTVNVGCSHLSQLSRFRNSTLSNMNPAPDSMSPPKNLDLINDVHLQSKADYHFALGEAQSLAGKSKEAIESYKAALIYDPDSEVLRIRLATEYIKIGFGSEALEQAEAAVGRYPNSAESRLVLGSIYSSLKIYEKALVEFKEAQRLSPEDNEAPMYIGAIYAELERYEEASQHFTEVIKIKQGTSREYLYHYYLGRIYIEQGEEKFSKAEDSLYKCINLKPEFEGAILALSKLYIEKKQYKSAMKMMESYQNKFMPSKAVAKILADIFIEQDLFDKALKQLEILEGFDSDDLNVKMRMAIIYLKTKNHKKAAAKFKDIITQSPDAFKVRFYLGTMLEERGEDKKAIEEYLKIPATSLYYPDAMSRATTLYSKLDQNKKAEDLMATALRNRPDEVAFHVLYATILDATNRSEQALEVLKGAAEQFPESISVNFYIGSVYDRLNQKNETIKYMSKVLELSPEHVQALNYLAYTYADMGDNLEEAMRLVDRAIELQPNDGYIYDTKGWVYFKLGKIKEAIKHLEKAYSLKSDESIIAEHLGDAYYRHQLVEKAKTMYMKAARLEDNVVKLKQIKSKISAIDHQNTAGKKIRLPASVTDK